MRFRLTDDKIMSLKEFVTRKLSGKLKTNEFWALKHASFDVYKGEVMGIIGHNGTGSSRYAFVGVRPEISAAANSGIREISRLTMEDMIRVSG